MNRTFEGDLTGTGIVEYLMADRPDGTATFVGLEQVTGKLGETRRRTDVRRNFPS